MSVQISDEEDLLTSDRPARFRKVPTLGAAVVQIVLSVSQIILVFVLPSLYDKHQDRKFGSFSLLIYTHGAHWAAFLIIDQFLHHHHHKSRLMGYLEFYVKVKIYFFLTFTTKPHAICSVQTKNIRRAPFYILSIGNAVLMIVVMILHDLCDYNHNCSHSFTKVTRLHNSMRVLLLTHIC